VFDQDDLKDFADKEYRDGFLRTTVRGWIAYQVQALRKKLRMTQTEFAERVGTTQNVISKLENDKGTPNVDTLIDIAAGADVALLVQFVPYPEFLTRTADMSIEALQPASIHDSLAKHAPTSDGRVLALHQSWFSPGQQASPNDDFGSVLRGQRPTRPKSTDWIGSEKQAQAAESNRMM